MSAATESGEAKRTVAAAPPVQSATYNLVGVALAAVGAVAFSLRAIFVKLAYEDMSDPVTLLALRMIFALPFLLIAASIHRRTSPAPSPITRRDALALAALGFIGYYLSSFLDMIGLQYVAAGIGRLLLFLYPTIVVIISAAMLGKRISQREVVALIITYAGVALVVSGQYGKPSPNFWFGAALVMASALTFSIYLVGSGEIVAKLGSIRFTTYATAAASVYCIVQFLLLRPISALDLPLRVYELAIAMALFSTVLPLFMVAEALRRIGASRVAMISSLGPAVTVISGYLGLDERMSVVQTAGGVLIVAGVLIVVSHVRKQDAR
jgi:drug/metabolite transporter (DMT)-like permease